MRLFLSFHSIGRVSSLSAFSFQFLWAFHLLLLGRVLLIVQGPSVLVLFLYRMVSFFPIFLVCLVAFLLCYSIGGSGFLHFRPMTLVFSLFVLLLLLCCLVFCCLVCCLFF